MKLERITWLDGVKGLSCLLIFLHHFLLIFYPAIHFGDSVISRFHNIDTALSQSPLTVLVNGNFLVALFCTISGMVVSLQVMTLSDKTKLSDIFVKRYFRLTLPLLPVGLMVYVMLQLGWFTHMDVANSTQSPWAPLMYPAPFSLGHTIKSALVDTWFFGDSTLSTAFWMLNKLFYGTYVSAVLSVISWKYRRSWIVYLILSLVFFNRGDLMLAFILGTLLASLFSAEATYKRNAFVGVFAFAMGILLGGHPTDVEPTNFYRILNSMTPWDVHAVGAFLTLFGIWNCKKIQSFLSGRITQWLGSISYAVYLLHIPLLFSLTTSVFLFFKTYLRYSYAVLVSFLISIIALIYSAWLYNHVIERFCVLIQKRILKLLEGK